MKIYLFALLLLAVNGNNCPATGDNRTAKFQTLNSLKNRDIPSHASPLVLSVSDFMTGKPDADLFTEDKWVEITGYIAAVKYGGPESCNCHSHAATMLDYHIEVVSEPGNEAASKVLICEVTRYSRQIVGYDLDDLKKLVGQKVTIRGYLFYDVEHKQNAYNTNPTGKHNWRGTCWEVHPVFSITTL